MNENDNEYAEDPDHVFKNQYYLSNKMIEWKWRE